MTLLQDTRGISVMVRIQQQKIQHIVITNLVFTTCRWLQKLLLGVPTLRPW